MRLFKKTGLFLTVLCVVLSSIPAKADTPSILIKLTVGSKIASVNGINTELDVPPTIINGRTLVPIRFISEALGSEVQFDAPTRTILITAIDGKALLRMDTQNKQTIQSLESQIEALKKQLESGSGGIQMESDPPLIQCNNIAENTVITKLTPIDIKMIDQSPIAFTQTKIGDAVLSSLSNKYGTIDPTKFLSGHYILKIEAWDAFGNHGELKINLKIQNEEATDPLLCSYIIKEFTRTGPGGPPGGGGGQQPPGDRPTQMPYALSLNLENQSHSLVEVTNIEVYNAVGEVYKARSELSTMDSIKNQVGMSRIIIIPTGSFSVQAAMNLLTEDMRKEDLFKGWQVVITLFDSNMQKEITKNIAIS